MFGVWPRGSQILFASCRHAVPSAVGVFECESVVRRASIAVLVSRGLVPSYPRRSALITHTTTTGREYRDAGPCHANLAVPLLFFLALRPSPLPRACGVRAHRYSIIYLGNLVIHEPTGPVKRDTRRKILQYDGSVEHEVEEIIGVDGKPPRRICGGGRHEADQLEGCWEH